MNNDQYKGENDFERFLLENQLKIYKLHTTLSMNQFLKYLKLTPPYKYNSYLDDKHCFICYETLKSNIFIRKLKCNHEYHKKCIDKWLYTQFQNSKDILTCPICRQNV